MNEKNYGSLEACKRLAEAGIKIETEATYYSIHGDRWKLYRTWETDKFLGKKLPAPSMAEVWRELPTGTTLYRGDDLSEAFFYQQSRKISKINSNPTDALIYLKIWTVEQERKVKG